MDVFEYAMQMEKDGEKYYRELAQKSPDRGLARILTMLADQEVQHFDTLQALRRGEDVHADAGTFRSDAKNVFQELSESKASFDFSTPQVDLYKKAQETEQKSRDFYLKQAEEATSPGMKETLLAIAHEEKLHYDMLETMIELVSRPQPGNWLENAEWYHSDEY